MGTGWRRAFCTTISRDHERKKSQSTTTSPSPSPRKGLSFFSSASNPSTPRLRCRTNSDSVGSKSNPASPRSPLKLSLFKNSFKFRSSNSNSSCGVCEMSVKTGQGTAIYTAECGHSFHFPCIAAHVRLHGILVCPVCSTAWTDVPLLAAHKASQLPPQDKKVVSVASYNDDEPLLSVPIPEKDYQGDQKEEDEEEDVEEFQGFFVNPNPSCSAKFSEEEIPAEIQVRLLPETAVVSVSNSHQTYAVALRVKAPATGGRASSQRRRAPVDLVAVLGTGGTMTGAKLQMMKRAMRLVVSSLGPADRLSVITFSAAPRRLLPLRKMTTQGQASARRVIDRLVCGNGCSVSEALKKAAKVLEDRRERNPVASIILLSDAPPSNKKQPEAETEAETEQYCHSTRFTHIEIPVHAEDAFAKCVGGLLSVVVQDLRIELGFPAGEAEIAAIYSSSVGRPTFLGTGSIRIGDLYAEEERELLVELRVPIAKSLCSHRAISVRCLYKDPATKEVVQGREQALIVPSATAVRSERLRNVFIATRAVAESRRIVECGGELASAQRLVASARALVMQSSLGSSAEECVFALEAELAELQWRRQNGVQKRTVVDENGEPLTPTSAWRAAEQLAKVAMTNKSFNRASDLHGFENARF